MYLIMNCNKYIISNTGTTTMFFNYQDCTSSNWNYQVPLNPGQTKNVWAIFDTFSVPEFYSDQSIVDGKPFATPPTSRCTCTRINTPCVGQSVVSNGITVRCTGTQSSCNTQIWGYQTNCTPYMELGPGPGIGIGSRVGGTDSITFTFSQPLTSLKFLAAPFDGNYYPNGDVLTVTTNGGIPTIKQCSGCTYLVINRNTIGANNTSADGGLFEITTPAPFTSVTLSMPKTIWNGVRINLCSLSPIQIGRAHV